MLTEQDLKLIEISTLKLLLFQEQARLAAIEGLLDGVKNSPHMVDLAIQSSVVIQLEIKLKSLVNQYEYTKATLATT